MKTGWRKHITNHSIWLIIAIFGSGIVATVQTVIEITKVELVDDSYFGYNQDEFEEIYPSFYPQIVKFDSKAYDFVFDQIVNQGLATFSVKLLLDKKIVTNAELKLYIKDPIMAGFNQEIGFTFSNQKQEYVSEEFFLDVRRAWSFQLMSKHQNALNLNESFFAYDSKKNNFFLQKDYWEKQGYRWPDLLPQKKSSK